MLREALAVLVLVQPVFEVAIVSLDQRRLVELPTVQQPTVGIGLLEGPAHHVETLVDYAAIREQQYRYGALTGRTQHFGRLVLKHHLAQLNCNAGSGDRHARANRVRAAAEGIEYWQVVHGRSIDAALLIALAPVINSVNIG